MRHYIKSFILVVVSYSLAMGTPAAAKADLDSFTMMKNYVNGSGKKDFQTFFQKMERELPTGLYEAGLKKLKGTEGKKWFQAAKLADNYSYFRLNNSKVFIRTTVENNKTVFYANGIKIHEDDFRNINDVQNKIIIAYVAGLPSQKTSFWNIFKLEEANAATKYQEVGESQSVTLTPTSSNDNKTSECEQLRQEYTGALQSGNKQLATDLATTEKGKQCGITAAVAANTTAAVAGMNPALIGIGVFIIAALLLLSMGKGKKKNTSKEKPEDTNGVGRGGDNPSNPGGSGSGGVNCGTNCGSGSGSGGSGEGSSTPDPGTPAPPPTGGGSTTTDPNTNNNFGENYGRGTSNPVLKAKPKTK